jgi:hypothetical protein
LENGIEDLETILELNDSHLDALGVPLGYKLKILKRIKIIRQEKGMVQPESRQRPDSAVSNVDSTVREFKQQDYSELPPPKTQVVPPKSALKLKPKPDVKAVELKPVEDFREGEFNETESHNTFLEALNAWRGVKTDPKEVKFAEKKETNVNNGPQVTEGATKPAWKMPDLKTGPKESCWTCYKLKPKTEIEEFAGKKFCSTKCKEKFMADNMVKC